MLEPKEILYYGIIILVCLICFIIVISMLVHAFKGIKFQKAKKIEKNLRLEFEATCSSCNKIDVKSGLSKEELLANYYDDKRYSPFEVLKSKTK